MTEKEKRYDEEGRVIRDNRSQIKRERAEIKTFAQTLLTLPTRQYAQLPITATLQAALIEGKRLTGNALKRHLNYLTRLLDEHDLAAVRYAHEQLNHPFFNTPDKQKRIQSEILRLLNNDAHIYNDLLNTYQEIDLQHVRQLVRASQKALLKAEQAADEQETSTPHAPQAAIQQKAPDKAQRKLQKYLQSLVLHYDENAFDESSSTDAQQMND